jgi:hypothetical protein
MSFNTQTLMNDAYAEGKQIARVSSTLTIGSETLEANTLVSVSSQTYAQSLNGRLEDLTSLFVDLAVFALSTAKAETIKSQNGEVSVSLEIKGDDVTLASLTGKGTINRNASSTHAIHFQPFSGSGKIGDKAVNIGGEVA